MGGRTCCCGNCTVGQGTLTIAILNILGGIFSIIRNSIGVNEMINNPDQIKDFSFQKYQNQYIAFAGIQLFVGVVYLILSGCMVQGYRSRDHHWIMPWLVWSVISLALFSFGVVGVFFFMAFRMQFLAGVFIVVTCAVCIAVQTYFVLVVKHFVDELKGGDCEAT
ncbi:uncharacterized protein LOC110859562 [Folsomia candida]|uniref:Uncharacterized protein n=1 Tax=Folsomia candida TaxID=158441 RepID=A0A226DCI7_FOLCA|nr:uncharacterized protein LOC110859562 [Folsomia candida]OXA42544.1 hypothetical protein Fcan01_22755 [Folsomia candida]